MYRDLAWAFPIITPLEHYVEESEYFANVIRENARIEVNTLLHLGCGGGHNDHFLQRHFELTGVDISEEMLALAKKLNPEATYLLGDMRSIQLGRIFDALACLDAIPYMLTTDDLRSVFLTAWNHLEPGGVLLVVPDLFKESFQQNKTVPFTNSVGDVEITFVENYYDPDPSDDTYESTFIFLIRRGKKLEVEVDRHICGIFTSDTWHRLLGEVGFEVRRTEFKAMDGETYPVFVGVRPLTA
jgi:SAM-dependent methyltransferase